VTRYGDNQQLPSRPGALHLRSPSWWPEGHHPRLPVPGRTKAVDGGRPSTRGRSATTMTVMCERATIGAVIFGRRLRIPTMPRWLTRCSTRSPIPSLLSPPAAPAIRSPPVGPCTTLAGRTNPSARFSSGAYRLFSELHFPAIQDYIPQPSVVAWNHASDETCASL
jgi:hypothetical protein